MTPTEEQLTAAREDLARALTPILVAAQSEPPPSVSTAAASAQEALEQALPSITALILGYLISHGLITPTQARDLTRQSRPHAQARASSRANSLAHEAAVWAQSHSDTDRPDRPDRVWAEQAADSLATRAASELVEDAALSISDAHRELTPTPTPTHTPGELDLGKGWKKIWISRGDHRVRDLHRKLHGRPTLTRTAFWRWPLTNEELKYPGDPSAPLDQRIGCRCMLFYVPADISVDEIEDAFTPHDFEDFDRTALAASAAKPNNPEQHHT